MHEVSLRAVSAWDASLYSQPTTVGSLVDRWAGALLAVDSELGLERRPSPLPPYPYVRALRIRTSIHNGLRPMGEGGVGGSLPVLDALDRWFRSFTMEDTDHLLALVTARVQPELWWWNLVPASGSILHDLRRLRGEPPKHLMDSFAWAMNYGVAGNRAVLETSDGADHLELSRELRFVSFDAGLWDTINHQYDLLIDAWEEEEVPASLLEPIADDLRHFGEQPAVEREVRHELREAVDFLLRANSRDQSVWFNF